MGAAERRKGAAAERELAKAWTELGFPSRRGRQYHGLEGRDVVGPSGVHIESKRTEKLQLKAAMRQAIADAAEGDIPLVCHRSSREPWMVSLRLEDLPDLIVRLYLALASEDDEC